MSNQLSPEGGPTPGLDPTVTIQLGSDQLVARRPSRGDESEIQRRYVRKLMLAALPLDDAARIDVARMLLDRYDGGNLHAEAQFEVLLVPRSYAGGVQSLGESAPERWFRQLTGPGGENLGRVVSFDQVSPEEFSRAAIALGEALEQKKSAGISAPSTSTGTAPIPTSG
jgi:hypothetical protein